MSLTDTIHVDHMLHLLPTTISDHEGNGALVGRYEVKGSRCPDTEALSVQEVMESVDTIRKFLLGGQGRWKSLYESAGPNEPEATLDAWREDMKTAATSLWTGPMESLILASSSGSNRLAFKMYRTRDDFKTLNLGPAYHTVTYVIPRFYQLQSPWAPISVTFDSSVQKHVFASDIYAPADQWESCKSALKSALESLRLKTPEQVKMNPAAGRNQADEWRGTLGISVGMKLRARSAKEAAIKETLLKHLDTSEGKDLLASTTEEIVGGLKEEHTEALGSLSAYHLKSDQDRLLRITWMKLIADQKPDDLTRSTAHA